MNFSRMETRALLYCHFCNKMKKENYIPDFVRFADVTPKYKGNGSKKDFLNERGIFVVTILRSLLMKLIYQDYYSIIDKFDQERKKKSDLTCHLMENVFFCGMLSIRACQNFAACFHMGNIILLGMFYQGYVILLGMLSYGAFCLEGLMFKGHMVFGAYSLWGHIVFWYILSQGAYSWSHILGQFVLGHVV